ncbi:peptidoglycan-associated lipoprotein Pal [Pseudoxanthomonas winnipegensis]|jgi:peptidoglycan-associated lipoprotein|uniref:Peptidoglycan-associated lipoprotein n=1 Tax=Pseudoxanthomonas winnipegensis TaxID=2480810 RepID=A0AAW8GFF4_9GAMM|nr:MULTISPECIES: peptidoglycan-associated lipoprotein Pal [Pseudoxanthomonas]MDQ1119985.1 peptidoglycan-associated lipoprotein [Pseudoxanthomonas winnipegensis]MDQ1133187.1 peptidoglycan-associated lipoprotein [Pseudoxanthomonas winnipegensis]MDR6136811.1 peptidoglycan-associated lipoprotein [Pseudoxanthomonas sp. SORGH_AS_0997]TAA10625.1 peptidoglycan-associated lipoprotein Pal [Pseudoxanthomonas winnipegensis]TAA22218.1 peptidoglycan-associated lipoprotein Pal [Pseudoxanthomonas winnipegensi
MNTTLRVVALSLMSVAVLAGCKKNTKAPPPPPAVEPPPAMTQPTTNAGAYGPSDLDTDACLRQRVVYFDLDQDAVKPEFQAIMACHAKYLNDRPSARINLEGNTDERGSREYNMGLGERRGNAVSSALQAAGGSASQLSVVSYGEERPVCTESTEECWAKNRRVEIVYTAK